MIAGHPARLRFFITYRDADDVLKFVPPESIWVTFAPVSNSNVQVNDQIPSKIFAEDSTRNGVARIFFPSVSGSGKLNVTLFVSGVNKGTKAVTIRTTDSLDIGRVTSADAFPHVSDLNYSGTTNGVDGALVSAHSQHWHRQALHGGMVRRTNYCESCSQDTANTRGESGLSWAPNGRYVAYTSFVRFAPPICVQVTTDSIACDSIACKVFIVPSDPQVNAPNGDKIRQITSTPMRRHDYDPVWSPDGTFIVFDRGDSVLIQKGIFGFAADTSDVSISASACSGATGNTEGDVNPAISPDEQWVAFSRCNTTGGHNIWKVPIGGGTPTRLTPNTQHTEFYPSWTPDGQWVYFQRQVLGEDRYRLCRVSASGGSVDDVFVPAAQSTATVPTFAASPGADSLLLFCGYGPIDTLTERVATTVFDPLSATLPVDSLMLVRNYVEPAYMARGKFPIVSSRISPDGTRVLLGGKQIWTSRRNMNRPPVITSVGGTSINDTTVTKSFIANALSLTSISVTSSDPEGDVVSCNAYFLQSWMSFSSCNLSMTPPTGAKGHSFKVVVVVATVSGGDDVILLNIVVPSSPGPLNSESETQEGTQLVLLGANPSRSGVHFATKGSRNTLATLQIYDVTGRLVESIRRPLGEPLVWDGHQRAGGSAREGVYFYRARANAVERVGHVVLLR